jgi:hypothetical protein
VFPADKLAKEGTNGVPSDKTVGIPFVMGKEVIRSLLNKWKPVKVVISPRPLFVNLYQAEQKSFRQ